MREDDCIPYIDWLIPHRGHVWHRHCTTPDSFTFAAICLAAMFCGIKFGELFWRWYADRLPRQLWLMIGFGAGTLFFGINAAFFLFQPAAFLFQ
jgi:hypothetical protein